jgi:hypothetical protein
MVRWEETTFLSQTMDCISLFVALFFCTNPSISFTFLGGINIQTIRYCTVMTGLKSHFKGFFIVRMSRGEGYLYVVSTGQ